MENIQVCVRIKPNNVNITPNSLNLNESSNCFAFDENSIQILKTKEIFNFDKIFSKETTNENIYETLMCPNIEKYLNGYNISLFVYGQTSTGKTFTMRGNESCKGIIQMIIEEVIKKLKNIECISFDLKASYFEIYNETINDLLDASKKNLDIREAPNKGIFINNLTEIALTDVKQCQELLSKGDTIRVTAETKLNDVSSRSHSIFRLNLQIQKMIQGKKHTFLSQFNLIDLAGSENVNKAKTEGIRLKEGSNINKSLLALSNVIQKLSSSPKSFVNYRDSKLTRLLQPALNGNSKTMIICTINDQMNFISESVHTLLFGSKAKNIKTTIKANEIIDEKEKMIKENNQLKDKIKKLENLINKNDSNSNEQDVGNLVNGKLHNQTDVISALEKEVEFIKRHILTNTNNNCDEFRYDRDEQDSFGSRMNAPIAGYNNNRYFSGNKHPSNTPFFLNYNDSARKHLSFNEANDFNYSNSGLYNRYLNNNNNNTSNDSYSKPEDPNYNNYIPRSLAYDNEEMLYSNNNDNICYLTSNNPINPTNTYNINNNFDQVTKFYETIKAKDQEISSLTNELNSTIERCDCLIKDYENSFKMIESKYQSVSQDVNNKQEEIMNLNKKIIELNEIIENLNQEKLNLKETENSYLEKEKLLKELQTQYNVLKNDYVNVQKTFNEEQINFIEMKNNFEGIRNENRQFKVQNEFLKNEVVSIKNSTENIRKNNEKNLFENEKLKQENQKLKMELNEQKEKSSKMKIEFNQIKASLDRFKEKSNNKKMISISEEYEARINFLEKEIESKGIQMLNEKIKFEEEKNNHEKEIKTIFEENQKEIENLKEKLKKSDEKVMYFEKIIEIKKDVNKSLKETPFYTTTNTKTNVSERADAGVTQFSVSDKENICDFLNRKRLMNE